jgi:hypothetical protein
MFDCDFRASFQIQWSEDTGQMSFVFGLIQIDASQFSPIISGVGPYSSWNNSGITVASENSLSNFMTAACGSTQPCAISFGAPEYLNTLSPTSEPTGSTAAPSPSAGET